MIIDNLAGEELVFRAHGEVLKLKVGLNNITTAIQPLEIKRHFGSLVNVYDKAVTLVTEPKDEVLEDEEIIGEDNTQDTADDNISDGEAIIEQEVTEETNELDGEEDSDTEGDVSGEPIEDNGKDEGEATEEGTEELDIDKLKRPALLAKCKELGVEGSLNKFNNEALKELIKSKLG